MFVMPVFNLQRYAPGEGFRQWHCDWTIGDEATEPVHRVLAWILERVEGTAPAVESPLGWLPAPGAIDHAAAGVSDADWAELFSIDPAAHLTEADDASAFFDTFEGRVPAAVTAQLTELRERMSAAQA